MRFLVIVFNWNLGQLLFLFLLPLHPLHIGAYLNHRSNQFRWRPEWLFLPGPIGCNFTQLNLVVLFSGLALGFYLNGRTDEATRSHRLSGSWISELVLYGRLELPLLILNDEALLFGGLYFSRVMHFHYPLKNNKKLIIHPFHKIYIFAHYKKST